MKYEVDRSRYFTILLQCNDKKCINKLCYNASQSEFSYFKYFAGILTGWLNCNCCFASHQKSESDSATEDGETELDNSDCESSDCEAL